MLLQSESKMSISAMKFCAVVIPWFLLVGLSVTQEEEDYVVEFIEKLCQPAAMEETTKCITLLPLKARDLVKQCAVDHGVKNTADDMKFAMESYCKDTEIRDDLFTCWDDHLDDIYSNATSKEVELMDMFQVCLRILIDKLLNEEEYEELLDSEKVQFSSEPRASEGPEKKVVTTETIFGKTRQEN